MKKMSILAIAALSLFGLNLYADDQDEPVKDEPVATTTEDKAEEDASSGSTVQVSFNDQEEESKGSFLGSKEEEKPTEDERLA